MYTNVGKLLTFAALQFFCRPYTSYKTHWTNQAFFQHKMFNVTLITFDFIQQNSFNITLTKFDFIQHEMFNVTVATFDFTRRTC
jgi:hypothetical protein